MKKNIFFVALLMSLLLGFFFTVPVSAGGPDPFEDASQGVKAPEPSLPENIKVFSGSWKGYTESQAGGGRMTKRDAWMVVKSVSEKEAIVCCDLDISRLGHITAEDATGKFILGEDGKTLLVVKMKTGNEIIDDFTLKIDAKSLKGRMGNSYVFMDAVKK